MATALPRRILQNAFIEAFAATAVVLAAGRLLPAQEPAARTLPLPFCGYNVPQGHFMTVEMPVLKKMADAGIDVTVIRLANSRNSLGLPYTPYPPAWRWTTAYDFAPFDREIADVLRENPRAQLICQIDLNTPLWLSRILDRDSFNQLGHCIHLARWRDLTTRYLQAVLRHVEKHHSRHVVGYCLCGGSTLEWFDRTRGEGSDATAAAYNRWCAERKLPIERIPDAAARSHVSHDLLRDPVADAAAIRYWRFHNESVASIVLDFLKTARAEVRPGALLGVYFGYLLSHGVGGAEMLHLGNADYERLFDSPDLDFVTGASYVAVHGGSSDFSPPYQSLRLRGKAYVHEMDRYTHTANARVDEYHSFDRPRWRDQTESIAGLRREMGLCLVHRASIWWFNIFGDFFQEEPVWDTVRQNKVIWDELSEIPVDDVAEVLLVVDPESLYYLGGDAKDPRRKAFFSRTRESLTRIGAPYATASLDDLRRMSLDRYKLLVFCNAFSLSPARLTMLQDSALSRGRTAMWLYAPGIIDGQRYRPERVEELCGCAYKSPGLHVADRGDWTSVYLHDPCQVDPHLLRSVAARAGVHLYAEEGMSVFANSRLLVVSDPEGGTKRIFLPSACERVIERFSGRVVAENTREFSYRFQSPDTALFVLQRGE